MTGRRSRLPAAGQPPPMLAVSPDATGSPPVPRRVQLPVPRPGRGEILVAVRATAVNHADLLQLAGRYPPPPGEPLVPGLECAGEVAAAGPEASRWRAGDPVMALLAGGGHAEWAVVPAGQAMPVPPGWSWEEAAALPESALTAWTNLVAEGSLRAGETVLVTGATGGIGSYAVRLARELGARVLATARDAERLARLDLAAGERIPDGADLPAAVRAATGGRGVDLVFDLVGGEGLADRVAALAPAGRLVLLGLLAGARAELDLATVLGRRLRLVGSTLRGRPRAEKAALVSAFHAFAAERMAAGRLRPLVGRVLAWHEIADAYAAVAAGGSLGKVVVRL